MILGASMKHRVNISAPAEAELDEAYCWIRDNHSPERASRWRLGLYDKIESLEQMPTRCSFAPENDWSDLELHQLLYEWYRIIFTIHEGEVHVLHIRHGARRFLSRDELTDDTTPLE
jgi:plasmid stabilization system protein ParE